MREEWLGRRAAVIAPVGLPCVDAGLSQPQPARFRRLGEARRGTVAWLEQQGHACTPSESNCFMVDLGRSGKAFQTAMATWGVRVGRTWPGFENWARISVGTEPEMARFRDAFTKVMAGQTGPLPPPDQRMALEDPQAALLHARHVC